MNGTGTYSPNRFLETQHVRYRQLSVSQEDMDCVEPQLTPVANIDPPFLRNFVILHYF